MRVTQAPMLALGMLMTVPSLGLAMNNPASAFCIEMGGQHETLKDAGGAEMSVCHLPDGRIIEEWTLFRMFQGKVPPQVPDANQG